MKTLLSSMIFLIVVLFVYTEFVIAQTMFRSHRSACPTGSRHAGSGLCASKDGSNFFRSHRSACPSGSRHAGHGFCRSSAGVIFLRSHNSRCPSGSRHAGHGFCRMK